MDFCDLLVSDFGASFSVDFHCAWQDQNQPALNEDADQAGFEDMEFFRRLNNTRKSRADKFLKDKKTRFFLLMTITLAAVIAPITRLVFSMHEKDKPDLDKSVSKSSKPEKRRRVRMHYKGSQAMWEESEPPNYRFVDICKKAAEAVVRLWQGVKQPEQSIFSVAMAFWPEGVSKYELHQEVMEDILRNIAAIKWRLQCRWEQPPYCAANLAKFDDVDSVPPETLQAAVRHLLSTPECCLDPFWAGPVKRLVAGADISEQGKRYFDFVKGFFDNGFRCASLKEERRHSIQRKIAGGHHAKVRVFAQQASQALLSDLATSFIVKGGRDLRKAPVFVQNALKHTRVRKTIHKRPGQFGNALFFFISKQKAMGLIGTFNEFHQQWKDMTPENRKIWKEMMRGDVRRNRVSIARSNQEQRQIKTLWQVGDSSWPLKESELDQFLLPFRTRGSGLQALQEIHDGSGVKFEWQKACEQYIKDVREKKTRYHSMTAASLACKAIMLAKVDKETLGETSATIMQLRAPQHHCMSKHPGLCRVQNGRQVPDVTALCKVFPKENCLLRCETTSGRSKKLVYVKGTIGRTKTKVLRIHVWGQ